MRTYLLAALSLVVTACSQSLSIETVSDVPLPVITLLPLNMGIHYDDQLRNHIYEENSEERPNWTINNGSSQITLFDRIFPSMFENVKQLNEISELESNGLDAILVPHIIEMQFALPSETKTGNYEVWIKYQIELLDPSGDLIAEWPVTGYGKTTVELFKGRDDGLKIAANSAFRDAGAKIALNFTKVTDVKEWLEEKTEVCSSIAGVC